MQLKLRLLLMTTAVVFFSFVTSFVFGQATVETNLPDYSPGQVVTITGTNWYPGETVSINILSDCGCENFTYYVTVAADSTIFHTGFTLSIEHLGVGFTVTATGQTSLQVAQTTFHDAITIWTNPITSPPNSPGTSANPFTSGQTFDSKISVSGIGRGVGINGNSGNDRYNADGWSTLTTIDLNDYFYFTLTPSAGYHIKFNDFQYRAQRSNQGPTDFAVRSSLDGYTADISTSTLNSNGVETGFTASLTATQFQNITSAIDFR
jgi:hypothetical protein